MRMRKLTLAATLPAALLAILTLDGADVMAQSGSQ